MTYKLVKSQIKDGDLIAYQGKSLVDWIIRKWTKSPWTHVGIACWWGPRLMLLESYPGDGTRVRPLSHALKDAFWIPTHAKWDDNILNQATELLDLPYSWINDWRVAWKQKTLLKTQYQCAQYAVEILSRTGQAGLPKSPTPANVAEFFMGLGGIPTRLL
jgi:hypothetical protein